MLKLSNCRHITLKVFVATISQIKETDFQNLSLRNMTHIAIPTLHKLLSIKSLHSIELERCCFTNLMFRELPLALNRLVLRDMMAPGSKFITNTTNCGKPKSKDELEYGLSEKTPIWVRQLLQKTSRREKVGSKSSKNTREISGRDRYFIDSDGVESLFKRIPCMTYVEIDMPKTEDKKWFLKRREKYFVHRNIHHYPQLERLKAWRVEKSRGVAALVPVSLVDDKVRRPKEGGKETN